MKVMRHATALFAGIVAVSAAAQTAPQSLILKLPPMSDWSKNVEPVRGDNARGATSSVTPSSAVAGTADVQPGLGHDDRDAGSAYADRTANAGCDDATYGQPRVHGDVTVGAVGGNHVSGNYQSGTVNVSKAFGSCDHPAGGASVSISVGRGNFNGRRRGWR